MHLSLAKPGERNINYLGGLLNAMFWARLQPPCTWGKDSGPQRHTAATLATSDVWRLVIHTTPPRCLSSSAVRSEHTLSLLLLQDLGRHGEPSWLLLQPAALHPSLHCTSALTQLHPEQWFGLTSSARSHQCHFLFYCLSLEATVLMQGNATASPLPSPPRLPAQVWAGRHRTGNARPPWANEFMQNTKGPIHSKCCFLSPSTVFYSAFQLPSYLFG